MAVAVVTVWCTQLVALAAAPAAQFTPCVAAVAAPALRRNCHAAASRCQLQQAVDPPAGVVLAAAALAVAVHGE